MIKILITVYLNQTSRLVTKIADILSRPLMRLDAPPYLLKKKLWLKRRRSRQKPKPKLRKKEKSVMKKRGRQTKLQGKPRRKKGRELRLKQKLRKKENRLRLKHRPKKNRKKLRLQKKHRRKNGGVTSRFLTKTAVERLILMSLIKSWMAWAII